jgi:hypothetical protein
MHALEVASKSNQEIQAPSHPAGIASFIYPFTSDIPTLYKVGEALQSHKCTQKHVRHFYGTMTGWSEVQAQTILNNKSRVKT